MGGHGLDGRNDDEIGVGDVLLVEEIQVDMIHLRHKQVGLLLDQRAGLNDRLGGLRERLSRAISAIEQPYWSYSAFFDFGTRPKMSM